MSYYTRVKMFISGEDINPFGIQSDANRFLRCVEEFLAQSGDFPVQDYLGDFRELLENGEVLLKGWCVEYAEDLLKHLTTSFPNGLFGMRGMGEEFDDVWIRYAKAGEVYDRRPPPV